MNRKPSSAASEPTDWVPTLRAIPRRNTAAQATMGDGEGVCLRVPQRRPAFMKPPLSWIVPFKENKTHRLDELGSQVWRLCDGRCDVEAVIEAFAARYALSFHEARVAVTNYLRLLVQRGILAMELEAGPRTGPAGTAGSSGYGNPGWSRRSPPVSG